MNWTIFLLSFIPAVIWIGYIYFQDKYEKEPFRLILWTFFLGCLSVIPGVFIELFFQNKIDFHIPFSPLRILITMLMVAFTEEIVKFAAVYWGAYKKADFNEPMDGIVYGVTAAVGFAFVENIFYMLKFKAAGGLASAYTIGTIRAFTSMFGHFTFGIIMGSYLGRARFSGKGEKFIIFKGIFFAALVHALYNFTLGINREALGGALLLLAYIIMWRNMNRVQVDKAETDSPFKPEEETYQPKTWHWSLANVGAVIIILSVIFGGIYFFEKPKTHKDRLGKYLIQHPSYWKMSGFDKTKETTVIMGPSYQGVKPRLKIIHLSDFTGNDPDKLIKDFVSGSGKGVSSIRRESEEDVKIDETDGVIAVYTWKGSYIPKTPEMKVRTYVASAVKGNRAVIIQLDSREDMFDYFDEKFRKVIESFKFSEPK